MLTQITETLFLNLDDIYLIDKDDHNDELMIYINQHPKIPLVLKGEHIMNFYTILNTYLSLCENEFLLKRKGLCNEQSTRSTKND